MGERPAVVIKVAASSPAARAGIEPGDEILSVNGLVPRDVIELSMVLDEPELALELRRGGLELETEVQKQAGEPLGIELDTPLFDRVRTCDNHCAFCFIYQLPKGLRRSLYIKDDDYRLSFLYGNFTTLTRFTEADLERVIDERLSPLYVSIHAADPEVRAQMLRNPRGATSLRWLGALLDAGVEVHGQVVVCPGINDGAVLEDTLASVLDTYPRLASLGVVPAGVSRYNHESEIRPHSRSEAEAVLDLIEEWQGIFLAHLGRRMVFGADEYYLLAGRSFPPLEAYEGLWQHENGIGMAAAFRAAFFGDREKALGVRSGFFAWVEGAPPAGYRARRLLGREVAPNPPRRFRGQVVVLTGAYGAAVLGPLLQEAGFGDVSVVGVKNEFFGGNIGVAGLLVGSDIAAAMRNYPAHTRFLMPDACLSEDRFLDGTSLCDLPGRVEVLSADGASLRQALEA
jgi:putative radical SAM enzyme (TIGR03279 family)